MFRKSFLALLLAGAMVFSASAGSLTTSDNAITVTTPTDNWKETKDSNYWVSFSDGNNTIAIDRLKSGEAFPALTSIKENSNAISMDFYTTLDNNYVVKTLAALSSDLETIRKAISTITIKESKGDKNLQSSPVTYYISAKDGLNVRSGAGKEFSALATLPYAQPVPVIGFVSGSGGKDAWARISYNNGEGFVFAEYISATPVVTSTTTTNKTVTQPTPSAEYVTCPLCGLRVKAGAEYNNHMLAAHPVVPEDKPQIYCEYCGRYIPAEEFYSHMSTYHPTSPETSVTCPYCGLRVLDSEFASHLATHEEPVYETCPYCGLEIPLDEYDAHIQSHQTPEYDTCPYCGAYIPVVDMEHHIREVHETPDPGVIDPVYYCSYCGQVFDSQEELMYHSCPGEDLNDVIDDLPGDYGNSED